MSDFNIKEIDFYSLDLEKYIDWLLKKYELFSTVWEVAYFDEFIDDLHGRKYFASSHYLMTRTKKLPENIEKAYNNKISHFEAQKNKYNGLIIELYRFKSVGIKKIENNSKYIFLTSEQLKNVKIDVSWLAFWMNEHKESYYVDLIDEIDTRKLSTPLNDVVFYQKEKDKIINDFDFDYLPIIMNGGFIFDLDNDSNALSFSTEIDKCKFR
ncbi:hypothetical protein [Flavobacterium laiguense]|uniref:Uncharacterized protein n=1 Tax=Flavobacterium laiguense TaxID=2169409 RepID=A0A2U1JIZ8_9FLAO|nr:hypothetical protein [Flavobacterium laiguense]PWA04985.1 hypothetical protein DB891_17340 [Flavobacterium laiguense]